MNDLKRSIFITSNTVNLGNSFKGGYAKKCGTYNKNLRCPDGTFAKEVEWDTEFEMTKGIILRCYRPESYTNATAVLESHPGTKLEMSDKRKCAAITGITLKLDDEKESVFELDLKKNCSVGYSKGIRASCDTKNAVTGIDVVIEERSK